MTITACRRAWSSLAGTTALVVLFASRSFASPIIVPSVSSLPSGLFEYSYTLQNTADSFESLFDFGLFFTDTETASNVIAPPGWTVFPLGPGFVDWFSVDASGDLLPGASLAGFSLQSVLGPGSIAFRTVGYPVGGDPFDANPETSGFTLGPVPAEPAPDPVPEPVTLWLTASGLAGVVGMARRTRAPRV